MNMGILFKIVKGCRRNVLWKLIGFAFKGRRAVISFEKRKKQKSSFFPAFLMLSITNKCNLKCKGCWVEQTPDVQELSVTQIQNIINSADKYDSRFFGILGGEPLIHNGVPDIFEKNKKAYFLLFTNGTLLNDSICNRLAHSGNVTPVISIEGLEKESDIRRCGNDVFSRSLAGLEASVKAGLFTGVAASITSSNFNDLVSKEYLDLVIKKGAHYIWYYIYRPCGKDPYLEYALNEEQIYRLRQFIVEQRTKANIIIIDAYWDACGNAVCAGDMGLSHHIAPNGGVEFCPVIQFTGDYLNKAGTNLEDIFSKNNFLPALRKFSSEVGRNCIFMDSPNELADFIDDSCGLDSSNRNGLQELQDRKSIVSHGMLGREIPEKSWVYRLVKKYYFFGFGAYG